MTNQRKPRGPYRKSAERRKQILQAAYEAVDEYGERASLHAIAARIGVTHAALTYYFPTRDDLLLAVLEHWDVLGKAVAGASEVGRSAVDGILATTHHITDHPGLAKLYVTLSAAATDPDSPAHPYFAERYRRLSDGMVQDFRKQQDTGSLRADIPAPHLARALLAVLDGLQLQWMHDPDVDITAIAEAFTQMMAPPPQAPAEDK